MYGPNCVDTCPAGFITNVEDMKCEGCDPGCAVCDEVDQRICLECNFGLMLHEEDCVSDCPRFFLANFYGDACYPISDIDVKLIYFPFLIIISICFGMTYIGARQKKKHLLVPNFLFMMGIVEHAGLVT